ncbi:hypothetical protein [uncultured Acetatifactor sp.]|uniref:hypothetical protein n=1 Tax=uncultured Acetatifactor sp. TaxID=1671927 RepID=UPI0026092F2A|nr:hypothetical protein [uncultured Acetatifactor sp.]MCI9575060.1 hypothetical protein [Lachnospiraceae bacterium]
MFALLPLRGNKAGLERILDENPAYEKLDEETAETISALMGVKEKHGKLCKPRHHPKYSRTAKAFPVFAK